MAQGNGNGQPEDEPQGLVYPCEFPIKMFGNNHIEFIAAVERVIEEHVPREDWAYTKKTPSRNEKYISYTVVIIARDRVQLDKVCAAVTECPHVIMAL